MEEHWIIRSSSTPDGLDEDSIMQRSVAKARLPPSYRRIHFKDINKRDLEGGSSPHKNGEKSNDSAVETPFPVDINKEQSKF